MTSKIERTMFYAIYQRNCLWHPLIILLVGLRPTWRREKVRGHLALRQGTLSPAPLFMSGCRNYLFTLALQMLLSDRMRLHLQRTSRGSSQSRDAGQVLRRSC